METVNRVSVNFKNGVDVDIAGNPGGGSPGGGTPGGSVEGGTVNEIFALNVDGGAPSSVYRPNQKLDCGTP